MSKPGIEWLSPADILAPLPEVARLIPGLDIVHGRPTLISSFGSGGKTISLQAMTLALCTGRKVWGHYPVTRPARVGHVDADQGLYSTCKRYQRLAAGLGVTPADLGDRLRLACMPKLSLADPSAEDRLVEMIEEERLDLVWLDAYRRLMPGADENDSRFALGLERCTRASERTRTPILVLTHTGKSDDGSAQSSARGTSALFDSAGAIFTWAGQPGVFTKCVKHMRPSGMFEGGDLASWSLEIAGDPGGPVTVKYLAGSSNADMQATRDLAKKDAASRRFADLADRVLGFISHNPGCTGSRIEAAVQGRASAVREAIRHLEDEGTIRIEQEGAAKKHHPLVTAPVVVNGSGRPITAEGARP